MHKPPCPIFRINPAPRDEGTSRTVADACIRGIQVTLGTLRFSAFVTIGSHGNKLLHQQIAFSALAKNNSTRRICRWLQKSLHADNLGAGGRRASSFRFVGSRALQVWNANRVIMPALPPIATAKADTCCRVNDAALSGPPIRKTYASRFTSPTSKL
jgi:hypothetical protein